MSILKKIQTLLLVILFTAGCTVIVYETPVRRARRVWEQHWHYCPYGGLWGSIYWQVMWYHRYPYYSRILIRRHPRGGSVISKKQLKKPASTQQTPKKRVSTKVVKKKEVKEKTKKVIKKKKDV